jgi:hypothetical protein
MATSDDPAVRDMQERVQNVLTALNKYRTRFPDDSAVESVLTQVELIQYHLDSGELLSYRQKDDFNFNSVANTKLEDDESLATELYSIRNYASHSM